MRIEVSYQGGSRSFKYIPEDVMITYIKTLITNKGLKDLKIGIAFDVPNEEPIKPAK